MFKGQVGLPMNTRILYNKVTSNVTDQKHCHIELVVREDKRGNNREKWGDVNSIFILGIMLLWSTCWIT